mgnify:CR=1 FL=1
MEKIEKLNNELPEFYLDDLESRLETDPLSLVGVSQSMTDFCFVNRNPEEYGFCGFNFAGDSVGVCIFNFGGDGAEQEQELVLESESNCDLGNQEVLESEPEPATEE